MNKLQSETGYIKKEILISSCGNKSRQDSTFLIKILDKSTSKIGTICITYKDVLQRITSNSK